ncbi:MAG: radical SAM protein [Acidimicrobiia bacterium]|nr:radical SAM protein [Acidimicrobiia bacterium]
MRILLISCYELGHQPLNVAVPAALIRARGHDVRCRDLSIEEWDPDDIAWADRIAFSVPMHTATQIARQAIMRVRAQRPELLVAAYGLYAEMLLDLADCVLTGETDSALLDWVESLDDGGRGERDGSVKSDGAGDGAVDSPGRKILHLGREAASPGAALPARDLLPALDRYAHLVVAGTERIVGYVEASHGCAHRCRHCPVPVVYDGRIRIVEHDAVLADIAQQVNAGAQHITFGDPDFLNGVHHSLRIVRAMHERFPEVTFDCTVKVEHVLLHREIWAEFAASGCLFVVSAFESVDDVTLTHLDKGHTVAEMADSVRILREQGIAVRPAWMPFTPWTTLAHIRGVLDFVAENDLVGNVDPVHYTIRLLLPRGSLLLEHPDLAASLDAYDEARGSYQWIASDPEMDELQARLAALVEERLAAEDPISVVYDAVREACGLAALGLDPTASDAIPRLTESWFCCAEPTALQLGSSLLT